MRAHRGWSDDEWGTAANSLTERGLLDDRGTITAAGAAVRQSIEDGTDRLARGIVAGGGADVIDELVGLLRPLAHAVMTTGAVPADNNMGVPWPPEA